MMDQSSRYTALNSSAKGAVNASGVVCRGLGLLITRLKSKANSRVLSVYLFLWLCSALVSLSQGALAGSVNQAESVYTSAYRFQYFDIPRQRADGALTALGQQADITVIYRLDWVTPFYTNAVLGEYTLPQAVEKLLINTGLAARFDPQGHLIISQIRDGDSRMNSKKQMFAALTALFVGSGGSVSALGQEVEAAGGNRGLDEIIVTAEKREESIRDIPIAISAFTGESLSDAGAESMLDLQRISSSIQIGGWAAQSKITIRGIGSSIDNIGAESAVSVSQDGVVLARDTFFDAEFLDVERIEVLRGPQGTISGRNATGGAIKVYSKRPTEDFEGGVDFTAGNYNRFSTKTYLSGPILGSDLLGRIAVSTDSADGWIKNTHLDQEIENKNKVHIRASLLGHFNEDIEAVLTIESLTDRSSPQNPFVKGRARVDWPSIAENFGVDDIDLDALTFQTDLRREYKKEMLGSSLNLRWDISPGITIASVTGYYDLDLNDASDFHGTLASTSDFQRLDWKLSQFTQEITLTADTSEKSDFIFGALYMDESASQSIDFFGNDIGLPQGQIFNIGDNPEQNLKSYAIYTQYRYHVLDDLRVSLGTRYTKDEKDYYHKVSVFGTISEVRREGDWDDWTPKFSVDYTPSDNLMFFASVSKGFKAGGINTFGAASLFEPENIVNYEVGFKSDLYDGQVHLGMTAFNADYDNLQVRINRLDPDGVYRPKVENAATTKIKGLELDFAAQFTERWNIDLSATWLSAKFTTADFVDTLFSELGEQDLSGNTLPRSPEWKAALSSEYIHPIMNEYFIKFRADISWQDKVYYEYFNNELVTQDAYSLLGFSLALLPESEAWSVSTFINNALDERYFSVLNSVVARAGNSASPAGPIGTPRTYGIQFSYNF